MKSLYILLIIPLLLIIALYSALARVGWEMPVPVIAAQHGFLMVSGLFGTLISIERTFILKQKVWLLIPILSFGSVILLLGNTNLYLFGFISVLAAASLLMLLYIVHWYKHREMYFLVLALSAICWGMSAVVLIDGQGFTAASMWYILFLLYTIAAERLELSKFIYVPEFARPLLLLIFALLIIAQLIPFHWGSSYISGFLMVATGFWLMQYDVVKINMKKKDFFRFTGITLFIGYIWLMISGVLMLLPLRTFYHYDAVLHSFFIGFSFSMIYAHAPIIFPALVKRTRKPFHKMLYLPVFATHLLLLLRLYSDYSADWELRKLTGLLQVFVILSYFIMFTILMFKSAKSAVNTDQ